MPVSPIPDPTDQPMMAHDLGVRLPLGPPDGRAPVAPTAPAIPMIPVQTPPASPARSPRFVDASPKFDIYSFHEILITKHLLILMLVILLFGLSGGLRHLLIFVTMSSLMGELLGKRAKLQILLTLLLWPTFIVCLNLKHIPRLKEFQSGNRP